MSITSKTYGNFNAAEVYSGGEKYKANVASGKYNGLESYREWQRNPNYNLGEDKYDRIYRLIGSSHLEIMLDFGGGGYNMFGGYGRASLTSAEMGRIIGWGENQTAEAVNQTINVTKNLTRSQIRSWAYKGLTRPWVEKQLKFYTNSINKGGKKLDNKQLEYRKELMEKMLGLWK